MGRVHRRLPAVQQSRRAERYLEPDFIDRNFPALRKRLSGDATVAGREDGGDKVVIYDVDVKQFRPDNIGVLVKDGNVSVLGRTEKVLNGGGKYVSEELLGGIRVPADVEADNVTFETTPELRLKISRPDSAMSSADTSLAER
ncbi:hypothetical protein V5799_016898 [Amblyomma americanum]|uniref:SHSP domain-containing protein n=1 Tax=Amblyomma americanum TaxID=6943 RepID=A0AAQ4F4D8_AMBAM